MAGAGEEGRGDGAGGGFSDAAGNPDDGGEVCCGGVTTDGAMGARAVCSGASGMAAEGAVEAGLVGGGDDGGMTITAVVATTAAVEAMMMMVRNGIGMAVPILTSVSIFRVNPPPVCPPISEFGLRPEAL